MREIQSLNGWWDYRIGNGNWIKKQVPYSDLCVGISECKLNFDALHLSERAFLVFEGITYLANVTLNGKNIATLDPYIEHRIEITDLIKEKDNLLNVKITDMGLPFGPSAGWENYGGIIRNVYIEYTKASVIEDIVWHTEFKDEYKTAICYVEPTLDLKGKNEKFCLKLKDKSGETVAEHIADNTDGKIVFQLKNPMLWSPDSPTLYTLECLILANGEVTDSVSQKVGFKDLSIKGRRFFLNGEKFFLFGVNKHDLFGEEGHTYSDEILRRNLLMIKSTGANYVRLVHYPHNKRVMEIADEIGLLVSGEPGLWWSDMTNPDTCSGALRVLEGLIKRDKNHISIAFWLSFNECHFTLEFLMDSAKTARKADPYHMISGANCMSLEMTKENYLKCGFDFYTMHPYAPTKDRMIESAKALTEMPLVFTEWGGYYCDNNPRSFMEFIDTVVNLSRNSEESDAVLAGACYWEWAETYDFNRGRPACVDGILHEGLVDMYGNPTPNYKVFTEGFARLRLPAEPLKYDINVINLNFDNKQYLPLSMETETDNSCYFDKMIADSRERIKDYGTRSLRNTKIGPVLPIEIKNIGNLPVELVKKPYVLGKEDIVINVNETVSELIIIGNTSMPKGFPVESNFGDKVAEYIIEYADGSADIFTAVNGEDLSTATMLHGSSRINPVAANCNRAITFSYDKNFEQYLVNVKRLTVNPQKKIKNIRIHILDSSYNLLIYGITAVL